MQILNSFSCTQTRGRTGMDVTPLVFETSASTDSAIWANIHGSRNEATRTPDPYVPNVVRYQLRYIPIEISYHRYASAKVMIKLKYAKEIDIF